MLRELGLPALEVRVPDHHILELLPRVRECSRFGDLLGVAGETFSDMATDFLKELHVR